VDDILGFGGIANDTQSGGVERARKAVVELGEGSLIAQCDAAEEARVLELTLVGWKGRL
jgi:hypothetical protein